MDRPSEAMQARIYAAEKVVNEERQLIWDEMVRLEQAMEDLRKRWDALADASRLLREIRFGEPNQ